MLKTIYLIIIEVEQILLIPFLIFLVYSLVKSCYTVKNYKIRMIVSAILFILNIAEAIVSNKLGISMGSSIILGILWLIQAVGYLEVIKKREQENNEQLLEKNENDKKIGEDEQ